MKISLFIVFLLFSFISEGQFKSSKKIDSTIIRKKIDVVRNNFGYNKIIPKENELAILHALTFYPELDSTTIIFKQARIKTTLNARPTILSLLFRKKKNRKYVVRINDHDMEGVVTLNEVPFNAQIGLFGHEFNHFIDYQSKNAFQVIGRLFAYISDKSKEKFEKEIDTMTIKRGLGWQLYHWSYFVLNDSDASEKYKDFKKKIYLEPEEIKFMIQETNK